MNNSHNNHNSYNNNLEFWLVDNLEYLTRSNKDILK